MNRALLFILLAIFTVSVNAQKSKLIGSWLMTKVETEGGTEHPYQVFDFKEDGKFMATGIELATWKYQKKGKRIIMESKMDKDFNGESKILELGKTKLVIKKDGSKIYYTKLNPKKIAKANKKLNLEGSWQIESTEYSSSLLKFELPEDFTLIQSGDGSTETIQGTWMYRAKAKEIIFISFSPSFRGKGRIKKLTKNKFIFKNNGQTIKATRLIPDTTKIERLSFKEEDLPEEYTGEYQLPWIYFEEMVEKLGNIKELKYTYGQLVEEMNTLKHTSSVVSKIKVDPDRPSVQFSNFYISESETSQFSENYRDHLQESRNPFFPKREIWPYRIIGIESVTVPAGTFNCTVIEGFDGDTKIKYWMINDKPGVYAKIINEELGPFDELEYRLFELEEIKTGIENK